MNLILRRVIAAFRRQPPDDLADLHALADQIFAHQCTDFWGWWHFWLHSRRFTSAVVEPEIPPWPDDVAGELIEQWREGA